MSQVVIDVLEDQAVVASLHPGPKGTVRVTFELPHLDEMAGRFFDAFGSPVQIRYAYQSPALEIDRIKLKELKLSRDELAELGFGLAMRLAGLLRHEDANDRD